MKASSFIIGALAVGGVFWLASSANASPIPPTDKNADGDGLRAYLRFDLFDKLTPGLLTPAMKVFVKKGEDIKEVTSAILKVGTPLSMSTSGKIPIIYNATIQMPFDGATASAYPVGAAVQLRRVEIADDEQVIKSPVNAGNAAFYKGMQDGFTACAKTKAGDFTPMDPAKANASGDLKAYADGWAAGCAGASK